MSWADTVILYTRKKAETWLGKALPKQRGYAVDIKDTFKNTDVCVYNSRR